MGDYFVYCEECGTRVSDDLAEEEAAEVYVAHQITKGHDDLFVRKEIEDAKNV